MKFDGICKVAADHSEGETPRLVLTALVMAAYELSAAIEPDDPDELFPSKGFLQQSEVEQYIAIKPYGLQAVMHIAYDRLVMLDVRPERYEDRDNGREDVFVISVDHYGRDVTDLVERANTIMFDLLRGSERIVCALLRAIGRDVPDGSLDGPTDLFPDVIWEIAGDGSVRAVECSAT